MPKTVLHQAPTRVDELRTAPSMIPAAPRTDEPKRTEEFRARSAWPPSMAPTSASVRDSWRSNRPAPQERTDQLTNGTGMALT